MRIALLAPLPPEQSGIADYAAAFSTALQQQGATVLTPFRGQGLAADVATLTAQLAAVDWSQVDVVHAELGGGRNGEFQALQWLKRQQPRLLLTATVHDPERLIWRPARLPGPLALTERLPRTLYQAAVVLADPLTLRAERRLAARLAQLVTLTQTGAACLTRRLRLPAGRVRHIPHGNHSVEPTALPALPPQGPLKLLYFGFIYRGKGIEDLIAALKALQAERPAALSQLSLTLAGGTRPDMTFGSARSYLDELRHALRQSGLAGLTVNWQLDIDSAAIPALIQAHHVMVLPYRESARLALLGQMRGTSGALSWAAACGRSVISSDARAFAEEVSHDNGAVFAQGQPAALAREIARLLDEPALLPRRSAAAAALGEARRWPHVAAAFHAMYQQLLEGNPRHEHTAP
jgi:glycosyltransferase involved in cell wall biosynthesis